MSWRCREVLESAAGGNDTDAAWSAAALLGVIIPLWGRNLLFSRALHI